MSKGRAFFIVAVLLATGVMTHGEVYAGPLENASEFTQEVAEKTEERNIDESDQSTTSGLVQWDSGSGDTNESQEDLTDSGATADTNE